MNVDVKPYLEAGRRPMIDAVKALVRIPSVLAADKSGFPFGEPIDRALRLALKIAENLGFRTRYGAGGYYGYAELGQGDELVGVLGHVDVVPPGKLDDWRANPFKPVEVGDRLYGRGTQDDKGPMMAALFAAAALKDAGVVFNKRLRFIFGTDEENLWGCMARYKLQEEIPGMGFSPDSRFPVIYAERGLLQCVLEGENESGLHLAGGDALNAVPASILYEGLHQLKLTRKLAKLDFDYELLEGGVRVLGKAAHAMQPEEGINALDRLCIALHAIGVHSKAIDFIAQEVGEDPYAIGLLGDQADPALGRLKFNVGKIDLGDREQIFIDTRLPATVSKDEVVSQLSAHAARYGLSYRQFDWLAPHLAPLDSFLVQTLLEVYREVTGDRQSLPLASGGASYARAFDNCVAYGATLPDGLITEHQPNEFIILKDLYLAMDVYAEAIYRLTR